MKKRNLKLFGMQCSGVMPILLQQIGVKGKKVMLGSWGCARVAIRRGGVGNELRGRLLVIAENPSNNMVYRQVWKEDGVWLVVGVGVCWSNKVIVLSRSVVAAS